MDVAAAGSTSANAIEGLKKAEEKTLEAAESIAAGALNPEDIVSLSLASQQFKLNVAVLKTDAEMTRSLLDIVA